jgi:response regulator RpfG family c-di-GMP phosphodiesterase
MPSVRSAMSIGIMLLLILSSLLMVLSASKADAQAACQLQLDTLESTITSANFTNENDRQNLLTKLTNAEAKLAEGKTQDAVAKITDIQSAVGRLAERNKLDPDDARAIDTAARDAKGCLQPSSST